MTIEEECTDNKVQKLANKSPQYGQTVFAIGCPEGFCGMVTRGIVSAYRRENEVLWLYTDAKLWFGNSGGPLFNAKGEVVGICSKIKNMSRVDIDDNSIDILAQNYGIFIPLSEIKTFLQNVEKMKEDQKNGVKQ